MQPIRKAICGIEGADRNKIVPVVARDAAHVQQAHDRNLWVSTISIWPLQHKDLSEAVWRISGNQLSQQKSAGQRLVKGTNHSQD
ncbi:hypothetical protein [Salinibacter ruber]|uniref:hypothetical protein n=1 Tax=Salinibacter ruber TaxID=146919 RepID=UPI002074368E|nr:hypothetical protein [Salinibacter ruber]